MHENICEDTCALCEEVYACMYLYIKCVYMSLCVRVDVGTLMYVHMCEDMYGDVCGRVKLR